jgi:hypothetical protein
MHGSGKVGLTFEYGHQIERPAWSPVRHKLATNAVKVQAF